ncbi:PAS domain-containing protein [Rhodobacteraceae bacterium SC52]|nr:PAS domain-containing protein [Rhodobacteraceae bacterium SC52]
MKHITSEGDISRIEALAEIIDQPMFMIDVKPNGGFIIRKINTAHSRDTGIDPALVEGKNPFDVLPVRLAETVCANYANCVKSRGRISYEELLELNTGARWWKTTLTPLADMRGTVLTLLGNSVDVTDQKAAELNAIQELALSQREKADMQVFATLAARDVADPLATLVGMLDLLAGDFVDMGDGKVEMISASRNIAMRAMGVVDRVQKHGEGLISSSKQPTSEFCIGHICKDAVALSDPEGRLAIELPEMRVNGDKAGLQLALHRLIRNACEQAKSRISVKCMIQGSGIALQVCDDGDVVNGSKRRDGRAILPESNDNFVDSELLAAVSLIEMRGGSALLAVPPAGMTAAIEATFPSIQPKVSEGRPAWPVAAAPPKTMAVSPKHSKNYEKTRWT